MILVTTDHITGRNIKSSLGLVRGNTIRDITNYGLNAMKI